MKNNIKVTPAKSEGRIKAYVSVTEGRITTRFNLVNVDGKYYLNPPATFVKALKGKDNGNGGTHTGFIDNAYFNDKDYRDEVIQSALEQLGVLESTGASA